MTFFSTLHTVEVKTAQRFSLHLDESSELQNFSLACFLSFAVSAIPVYVVINTYLLFCTRVCNNTGQHHIVYCFVAYCNIILTICYSTTIL